MLTYSPQSVPNSPREFLFILFLNPDHFPRGESSWQNMCAAKTLPFLANVRPDLTHALISGGSAATLGHPSPFPILSGLCRFEHATAEGQG